jgi:acyl carrier protein
MASHRIVGFMLVVTAFGCFDTSQKNVTPKPPPDLEKTVRDVIAKQLNVKPDAIDMRKPLSDPPLKADDLDVVEMLMSLEERLDVFFPDSVLDKYDKIAPKSGPSRVTAADLVTAAEEALSKPMPRKKR